MQYPIFSGEWHGLSLSEIAARNNLSPKRVADHHFYAALYERWAVENFAPAPGWVEAKLKIARILGSELRAAGHTPPSSILSVGAGLGLVEASLMEFGWSVTLQECQKHSFAYLRRVLGDRMPPTIIDSTIANLQPQSFDVILALSLTYAFDRPAYRSFLADAHRALKPNGLLVNWEHDSRFFPLSYARIALDRLRGRRFLRWGWVRGPKDHVALARKARFVPLRQLFFDPSLSPIPNPLRIADCQLPFGPSHAQLLIARKTP